MKLIGFERGVTLIAGYAFPITTPAHGTAYDIAGRGSANPGASRKALLIAARLARTSALTPARRTCLLQEVIGGLPAPV
jgi:4-hydroxythreonine-4-phosphate dehydrogenase